MNSHKLNATGERQPCCPQCGRFIDPDAHGVYFHCAERVPAEEWDQHYQAAFCNQQHADKFHGAKVQS